MRTRIPAATLLFVSGLALTVGPARSQQPDASAQPPQRPAAEVTPPPADRFGVFDGGQLQLESGTEDDKLTFRIGLPTGPALSSHFSASVSTPLQGDDETRPASLDALANGTRLTLSWGYFDVPTYDPDEKAVEIEQRAQEACANDDDEPAPDRCRDTAYAVWNHARSDWLAYRRHSMSAATDFGFDATFGFNDFEWFDRASLLPREERRTDWSVAAHVARYLARSHTALTASVSYQRAFEAADEERVCPPDTTDPEADCPNLRTAGPTRNENLLLAVGVRHRFFRNDRLSNLAIAPVATYDVIDDVVGVDVPIYYTPDDEGGLNGGIRLGYRSDREDEFSIAFFVGTTFDIFGGR